MSSIHAHHELFSIRTRSYLFVFSAAAIIRLHFAQTNMRIHNNTYLCSAQTLTHTHRQIVWQNENIGNVTYYRKDCWACLDTLAEQSIGSFSVRRPLATFSLLFSGSIHYHSLFLFRIFSIYFFSTFVLLAVHVTWAEVENYNIKRVINE